MQNRFICPRRDVWWLLPGLAGFLLCHVLPFLSSLVSSFLSDDGANAFAGLANYAHILSSSYFRLALWNTLQFLLLSAGLCVFIGLLSAHILYARRRAWAAAVLIVPLFLPSPSIVPLWRAMLGSASPLTQALQPRDADWKYLTLLLLFLWKNVGAVSLLFLTGLRAIDPDIPGAARVDGASGRVMLLRITLPLLRPVLLFALMYLAMNGLRVFRESYLLFGAYPPRPLYFIQNYVNIHFGRLNYGLLSAASTAFALVVTLLFGAGWAFLGRREGDVL